GQEPHQHRQCSEEQVGVVINFDGIETLLPALFHLLLAGAIRFCKLNNPMMSRIATDLRQRHVQP
ncbi:hypothetical protein ACUODJ_17965, partial [Escherichia sp. HC-CC]